MAALADPADAARSDIDIAYFYSAPLVQLLPDGLVPLDMLNIDRELTEIRAVLRDTKKKVVFRSSVATVGGFRNVVSQGCRIIHFSGHGDAHGRLTF